MNNSNGSDTVAGIEAARYKRLCRSAMATTNNEMNRSVATDLLLTQAKIDDLNRHLGKLKQYRMIGPAIRQGILNTTEEGQTNLIDLRLEITSILNEVRK